MIELGIGSAKDDIYRTNFACVEFAVLSVVVSGSHPTSFFLPADVFRPVLSSNAVHRLRDSLMLPFGTSRVKFIYSRPVFNFFVPFYFYLSLCFYFVFDLMKAAFVVS